MIEILFCQINYLLSFFSIFSRSSLSEFIPKEDVDLDDEFEDEGDNSDSEDDPDRLWCICKRPHNNRFMICCDVCEDWFHGKCVNVSKSMGKFLFFLFKFLFFFLLIFPSSNVYSEFHFPNNFMIF